MAVPVYKCLLVGDSSVGKSSLIRRVLLDEFDPDYSATVGVDLSAIAVNVDPITPVILTAIDLGGQEDFGILRTQYYKGAHYAALVYDVTNLDSFKHIPEWEKRLMNCITSAEGRTLPCILIANKVDLTQDRRVSEIKGRLLADENRWDYYETSALSGLNASEVFARIAKELYATHPPVKSK